MSGLFIMYSIYSLTIIIANKKIVRCLIILFRQLTVIKNYRLVTRLNIAGY